MRFLLFRLWRIGERTVSVPGQQDVERIANRLRPDLAFRVTRLAFLEGHSCKLKLLLTEHNFAHVSREAFHEDWIV